MEEEFVKYKAKESEAGALDKTNLHKLDLETGDELVIASIAVAERIVNLITDNPEAISDRSASSRIELTWRNIAVLDHHIGQRINLSNYDGFVDNDSLKNLKKLQDIKVRVGALVVACGAGTSEGGRRF